MCLVSLRYDVRDSAGNAARAMFRDVVIQDSTPPNLTFAPGGGANVQHEAATQWVDPGVSAIDILDGDLTSRVVAMVDAVRFSRNVWL